MRIQKIALGLFLLALTSTLSWAAEKDRATIDAVTPSLVVVEITLQPDNGEQPYGAGWGSRCPNCGQIHSSSVNEYVEQERPMEMAGFVVGDDLVVMPDPMIQDRFIKSIAVRQGDAVVAATIERVFVDHRAVTLKLEKKLPAAKPLVFNADAKATDLKTLVYANVNGGWNTSVSAFTPSVTLTPSGERINSVTKDSLIVTAAGSAVGLVFSESLNPDGSWKGSPLQWKSRTATEDKALAGQIEKSINNTIVRVHLGFRSPRSSPNERISYGRGEDENATERHVHGIVIAPNRVLVLINLKPTVTARLERVTVHPAEGEGIKGKFVASIKDYAAIVIETETPLPAVAKIVDQKPDTLLGPALVLAEVRLRGEIRSNYLSRTRLSGLKTGWRKNLFPEMALSGDTLKSAFVVDDQAQLVALPILVRPKPKGENDYGSDSPELTFATQLQRVIADPIAASDPNNIPLSEEDENRLAWLGVELQPLTPDLARLNKVAQQTNDGESGALVTYVYPDSPAAKAGIEVGAVLLRLHVPEQAAPIDIEADEFMFAEREFPWQQYDQFPEAYFDQMPAPWPSVATKFAKTLTEIGFGKKVTLELFQSGKELKLPIEIAQSPVYFDTAKRLVHAGSGLTVKPMTFELRRYFQVKPDAPGLIVAVIEPGSLASKAGMKPYEYVTQVNGQPVSTPDDFAKAVAAGGEVRLDVVRMNKSRVVKIKLDAANPEPKPEPKPLKQGLQEPMPAQPAE